MCGTVCKDRLAFLGELPPGTLLPAIKEMPHRHKGIEDTRIVPVPRRSGESVEDFEWLATGELLGALDANAAKVGGNRLADVREVFEACDLVFAGGLHGTQWERGTTIYSYFAGWASRNSSIIGTSDAVRFMIAK